MSRRSQAGWQPRDKLLPGAMRDLINDYNIVFRGPLLSSQWPKPFSDLFHTVRTAGSTYYDEYTPKSAQDQRFVTKLKSRADKLYNKAHLGRRDRVNEPTLRGTTEYLVFKRFSAEIKCQACRQYLWQSEFPALPADPVEAERLRRRRARRIFCACPPESHVDNDLDEPGGSAIFATASEQAVHYGDAEELKARSVPIRRPDLVFGLRRNGSLKDFCSINAVENLRHTPFHDSNLLYPFLVIEAKRAGGGPGFESIENQTAFPIRDFLKLQDDLQKKTGISRNPLVWFMAYEGDEWRLSACVIHQEKFQIIDLWMGRTTSKDGALQLLHLVDLIHDWARNTFRFEILCSLAGGKEELRIQLRRRNGLRYASPTYGSHFSSQGLDSEIPDSDAGVEDVEELDESDYASDGETIILHGAPSSEDSLLHDAAMGYEETLVEEHQMEEHQIEQDSSRSRERLPSSHALLKWLAPSQDEVPWTRFATVRHSDMPVFKVYHITIPEEQYWLGECVKQMAHRDLSVTAVARQLISSFLAHPGSVLTSLEEVFRVKNEWLKDNRRVAKSQTPVRALIRFRSSIQISDWQIVRELWAITCTERAAEQLIKLAEGSLDALPRQIWDPSGICALSLESFSSLHCLSGRDSATAAIRSAALYLSQIQGASNIASPSERAFSGTRHKWVALDASSPIVRCFSLLSPTVCEVGALASATTIGRMQMEVLGEVPPEAELVHLLGERGMADQTATILLKGMHWPGTVPKWCLMVEDEVDFADNRQLAESLVKALGNGQYYTFVMYNSYEEAGDSRRLIMGEGNLDERYLHAWLHALTS